jgi:hypothetical protein
MAMRRIGLVLADVMRDIEKQRAASDAQPAREFGGGTSARVTNVPPMLPVVDSNGGELSKREDSNSSPAPAALEAHRLSDEGNREPDVNEKDGAQSPASSDREEQRHGRIPVLRLVRGGKELRGVPRREQSSPALASRNSLLLVVDNGHAASLSASM